MGQNKSTSEKPVYAQSSLSRSVVSTPSRQTTPASSSSVRTAPPPTYRDISPNYVHYSSANRQATPAPTVVEKSSLAPTPPVSYFDRTASGNRVHLSAQSSLNRSVVSTPTSRQTTPAPSQGPRPPLNYNCDYRSRVTAASVVAPSYTSRVPVRPVVAPSYPSRVPVTPVVAPSAPGPSIYPPRVLASPVVAPSYPSRVPVTPVVAPSAPGPSIYPPRVLASPGVAPSKPGPSIVRPSSSVRDAPPPQFLDISPNAPNSSAERQTIPAPSVKSSVASTPPVPRAFSNPNPLPRPFVPSPILHSAPQVPSQELEVPIKKRRSGTRSTRRNTPPQAAIPVAHVLQLNADPIGVTPGAANYPIPTVNMENLPPRLLNRPHHKIPGRFTMNINRGANNNGQQHRAVSTENINLNPNLQNRGSPNPRFNRGRGRNINNRGRGSSQNHNNHNQNQPSNPDGPRGVGFFGFKRLEELLSKDPEQALLIFVNKIEPILNYVNSNNFSPDTIVLIFEVLANVIQSTFAESVAQLLLAITQHNVGFFAPVKNYIMHLPLEDSAKKNRGRRFWNAYDQFFINVALTLDAMVEVLPSTAMDIVPDMLKAILYTLPNIQEQHHLEFSPKVDAAFTDLQLKMAQVMEREEEKKKKMEAQMDPSVANEEPPPNDFHDIDVYPTALEITTRTPTYLRKNLIKGAYKDVYTYLDVQFRLLREDFVAPLRDGICEYFEMLQQNQSNRKRLSNIKIYKDVRCLGIVPNVNQVGYLVQAFKPKSIRNLENTRRFMFGSLVCATPDNFTTIIFGKIIDRDKKYLAEGQLVLGFNVGVDLEINRMYTLVECTIFFEPYYQVLTALQNMNPARFPFKEYLVDVCTESEYPTYLAAGSYVENNEGKKELNKSQLAAYHAAMTSKFCIIQGPPGTGKTYLALKVARALLEDKAHWKKAPMLVICYTNHALDQFLEGLLEQTQDLVRVGGQSKNERLQNFNLRNLRVKSVPGDYFNAQRQSKAAVELCSRELSRYGSILKSIDDFASVLKFDAFYNFAVDPQLEGSWFAHAKDEDLLQWLLYQPGNVNEVKFADFEAVTRLIQDLKLQEQAQAEQEKQADEENDEQNDDETMDNPLHNQAKQNQLDIDIDEDLQVRYDTSGHYLFDVHKTHDMITQVAKYLREMAGAGLENTIEYLTGMRQMIKLRIDYDYVCKQLRMIQRLKDEPAVHADYADYADPSDMPANDRWLLYAYWLRRYRHIIMGHYVEKDKEYRRLYTKFIEVKDMLDLYKLKHVDVIGMTTTGAARLHKTLQALACPIVIVEEAAEVLEAHIITALSPTCQHLILIGDHKQLKPSTADYKITKEYQLGVSLFERMVENGLHCHTLDVQHRMRPEIANLVCPTIYPKLENHESVLLYPNVRGVDAPLYFITHDNPEKESSDRSKENIFEAEYLILLARYLALNNYDASRITIIAAYSGQWFVLLALKKKHHILRNMRVCILDNFQGEENDIILLSLVRNNSEGKNGFLNLENRICVALSRAKHGMYIMGNMPQLCAASPIWRQVSGVLEKYDALGTYLTVRCANHPENVTHLREVKDFTKVPEGGCLNICAKPLDCGHTCAKLCHSTSHDNYKCYQPCQNILCEFGHVCPDKCYIECSKCQVPKLSTLPCGHTINIPCYQSPEEAVCDVIVSTTLPCGHTTNKPCHADAVKFRCPFPCDARVEPCGHACSLRCHVRKDPNHEEYKCLKQCAKMNDGCQMPSDLQHPCQKRCFEKCDPCPIEVKKKRSCEHQYSLACNENVEEVECKRPCKRKLPCGHNCVNKCLETCGPCKVKVVKTIAECGHNIKWECGLEPRKENCKNKSCSWKLDCGHPCPLSCAKECSTATCMELVATSLSAPCAHALYVPCSMRFETEITNELLAYCTAKCSAKLECGHACPGTCGGCSQGRFHAACAQKCDKTLICGHGCKTPCVQNCQPCTRDCEYRCEHSKCKKVCGVPCTSCNEPCSRGCEHQRCRKKCGQMCDVEPCEEPCEEKLPCGHTCIGFCGDVCPPVCRICDADIVTEVFFGTEDEDDARFVYLPECKHTLEASGLEQWFGIDEGETTHEVKVLTCPKCKSNVQALRYRHYIRQAYENIQAVKVKYFGNFDELVALKATLQEDINGLKAVYNESICRSLMTFFGDKLKTTVTTKGKQKRQDNSKANLISLRARLDIFMQLAKIRYSTSGQMPVSSTKAKELTDSYLAFLIRKLAAEDISINPQQIQEFKSETLRFNRINQLAQALTINPAASTLKEFTSCRQKIFTFLKYDERQDVLVKDEMEALHKAAQTRLAITEVERKEIVGALNLGLGHWFKCPNGHLYIITECGGAMQESNCPECGQGIGGRDHALRGDNRFAPEMDGARAPAYPTVNNMALYQM